MTVVATYDFARGEGVTLRFDVCKRKGFPPLPRFGVRFLMGADFERIRYFGRGPAESYIDKCQASQTGLFETTATENFEHYIRPQENMAHCGTKWVEFFGDTGHGLLVTNTETTRELSFNCSHFTPEMLTAAHDYELVPLAETAVHIDCRQNGIGSNSCGPALAPEFTFADTEFSFAARLVPVFANDTSPFEKIFVE